MKKNSENLSRKNFIAAGLSALAFMSVLRHVFHKKDKSCSVKMLTQDGKLVEVNKAFLGGEKRKISSGELKDWVKK